MSQELDLSKYAPSDELRARVAHPISRFFAEKRLNQEKGALVRAILDAGMTPGQVAVELDPILDEYDELQRSIHRRGF